MESRIVEFIAALRGAGVRVSVAESADALRAVEQVGVLDRARFRAALHATLVKDSQDTPAFERLFPNYFTTDAPPMRPAGASSQLSEEQQQQMQQLLQQMLQGITPQQLAALFQAMMSGERPTREALREMLQQAGQPRSLSPYAQESNTRRALRDMQFDQLEALLQHLLDQLREAGFTDEQLEEIARQAHENRDALAQQIGREIGASMAQQQQEQRRQRTSEAELDRPFEAIRDPDDLRQLVQRMAQRLRTRAALRMRRGKTGQLDAKATIRANQRFGGVPLDMRMRHKRLKPKLVVLVDRSVSTENVTRFLLTLIYTLQDQISRTRSFAFIDRLHDISTYFDEYRPAEAISQVMQNVYPTRSYSTDLGACLGDFVRDHCGCLDRRTTLLVLGDARNNENDPNIAAFEQIRRRVRRIVWFNPEPPHMWGRYDPGSLSSDMLAYQPLCDSVQHVGNLRQLADAIDRLMASA